MLDSLNDINTVIADTVIRGQYTVRKSANFCQTSRKSGKIGCDRIGPSNKSKRPLNLTSPSSQARRVAFYLRPMLPWPTGKSC
jgi:hypothetical protein